MAIGRHDALEESWAIVDGLPLHYWRSVDAHPADSPTVIHLHGFGTSGRYMLPSASMLAARYRTYVPDFPGFGRSIPPHRVLGIGEFGGALMSFMDEIGIERATLVGNSMGCITAIDAARSAPDRVDRVVLVSPAGGPNNRPLLRGAGQLAVDAVREPPRMCLIAAPDYLRYGLVNSVRLFWSMIHYPAVERLVHVAVPTLIVVGDRDPLVSEQRIVDGSAANEHVAIARVEGAAHAMNFSHPGTIAHLVWQYMTDQPLTDDPASPGNLVVVRAPRSAAA